jgi:ATP-dependent DNA helicase RecG
MNSALDALRKILALEQQKGCADTVAIGGLDRFLAIHHDDLQDIEARAPSAFPRPQPSYHALGPAARRVWLQNVLGWLRTAPPPAPAVSPQPPARGRAARRPPTQRPLEGRPPARPTVQRAAPPPAAAAPTPPARLAPTDLVTALPGIRQGTAAKLARLGIKTVRDFLYTVPRRYLDYSQRLPIAKLEPGKEATVAGFVWEAFKVPPHRPVRAEAVVGDDTGNVRVVWFNQPWMADQLERVRRANGRVFLSGKVTDFQGFAAFHNPDYELEGEAGIHTGRLVPVYPLTEDLAQRTMRRLAKLAVDRAAGAMPELLPPDLRQRTGLLDLPQAIRQAHFPDDRGLLEAGRRRLAFDELLTIQLGVLERRRAWQGTPDAHHVPPDAALLERFTGALPFRLTAAQERALDDVLGDLARPVPMSRLLQGDVGSGKTVVAAAALVLVAAAGCQGVLMAPTEILAEQHFQTFFQIMKPFPRVADEPDRFAVQIEPHTRPIAVGLLTGSTPASRRRKLYAEIAAGDLDILIGTHAVIQRGVEFRQLALAIVDEQHRFGAMQRDALRQKAGGSAHILVMTATPIPRTLALTLYGDLDLSVIDQLPPGRQPIRTRFVPANKRANAYQFVRARIAEGRQAFIICPLIEESEALAAKAATAEHQRLCTQVFPDLGAERIGLLHGRMASRDKDAAMRRFKDGEWSILVSTPVVEVGIDVPNAAVMLIEGADRFGLSQLHQFRGRVGRGPHESYCLLLADDPSPEAEERLRVLERTQDGFAVAEADLHLRGPGAVLTQGLRQSGIADLRVADLADMRLLEEARREAQGLLARDPDLKLPEHRLLAAEVRRFWAGKGPVAGVS